MVILKNSNLGKLGHQLHSLGTNVSVPWVATSTKRIPLSTAAIEVMCAGTQILEQMNIAIVVSMMLFIPNASGADGGIMRALMGRCLDTPAE